MAHGYAQAGAGRSSTMIDRGPNPGLFRGFVRYTKADRARLLGVHLAAVSVSVADLIFPLLTGTIMNNLQQHGFAGFGVSRSAVVVLFCLCLYLWTVRVPLKLQQCRIAQRAQSSMLRDLNGRIFSAPLSWHEGRHSGDISSRVQQSSGALFGFTMSHYALPGFFVQIVGPLIALWLLSPAILVCALACYLIVAGISVGVDRFQVRFWILEAAASRHFNTAMVDGLRNVMTVYASRRRWPVAALIESRLQDVFSISRRTVALLESKEAAIQVVSTVFSMAVIVLYIYLQTAGSGGGHGIALGNVYMVQAYIMSGMAALLGMVAQVTAVLRQKADFLASAPIYEIEPEPECTARLPGDWTEVTATGVALTYRSHEQAASALRGVSLTLTRGRHYALVGANGSGKTTLLKLLAGLIGPDEGALVVDGAEVEFGALREAATLIPQHPELLEGTLEHNLLIAASEGEASAQLPGSPVVASLLTRLGITLDAHVHEGGTNWSGGQRQRIALARGILSAAGSSIVLVDEPTSSIDVDDERVTIGQIRSEFGSQCLIVAIHNLDLAREFDGVLVLEEGRLVDAGPPDIVSQRCGYFGPHLPLPSEIAICATTVSEPAMGVGEPRLTPKLA